MEKVYSICMIITIVSFLGFLVENIWLALTKGYMNNRNMYLPFLLGYGLAVAAIYVMFGTPESPRFFGLSLATNTASLNTMIYFFIVCACVMIGEIVLGTLVEKTTGIVWWNYTRLPLHLTKYTSVPTTICFGIMITVFMRYFFTPLNEKFIAVDGRWFGIVVITIMLFMIIDFIHSGIRMFQTHELMETWRFNMKYALGDVCAKALKKG